MCITMSGERGNDVFGGADNLWGTGIPTQSVTAIKLSKKP